MARFPFIIFVFVLAWALPAYAQAPSPYSATIISKGSHIKLQVFGLGFTEIRLSTPKQVTFHGKTVQTYRGSATIIQRGKRTSRKKTEAISAVGYRDSKGRKQLEVSIPSGKRTFRVTVSNQSTARIARGPLVSHFKCGHPSHSHPASVPKENNFTNAIPRSLTPREFREVEIAIDLDYEAKELLGERLVPSVVSLVETSNLYFERDLGVHLSLVNINSAIQPGNYPSPYTEIADLLDIFFERENYLGKADIYYLLVARELTGTVVGMAAVALQCQEGRLPSLSHATSGFHGYTSDSLAFAHEIGHLLWAGHTTKPGIMSTVDPQPFFEDEIRPQVAYLFSLPQSECLSKVSLVPQPTPTATPTVTPTRTPYPTPEPTATPLPRVRPPVTRLKITQDGTISGGVEVPVLRDGCSLSVHAGLDPNSARTSRPIASLSPVSSAYTLSGKVTQRVRPLSSRDGRRAYVTARYSCPGFIPLFSKSIALKPASLRKGRYTTPGGWVKHLKKVLKVN